jgi:hypothetical protein
MALVLVKKEPKPKLCRRERIANLITGSEMFATAYWEHDGRLAWVHIELRGKLAAIPSIKNQRFNGIPNTTNVDKVKALEFLFRHEMEKQGVAAFGDAPVFVSLLIGKKGRRSDPDNALTTVKDWLEPREKPVGRKKHSRGWGVGVVNNDSQITGFACRAADVGLPDECTTIDIIPVERVREKILTLIAGARLP